MISIIICSVNPLLAQQLRTNLAATIGVEYEIILINNTIQPKGITAVYNEGAAQAKYDFLCFLHEDIILKTNNWGKLVTAIFEENHQVGLVGIAGSKYKSKAPSGWFSAIPSIECCHITHLDLSGNSQYISQNPQPGTKLQPVAVLDGVFLCCPKNVWQLNQFDERLLTGFHLYDLDFSFRIGKHFQVMVTYEIDLVHLTQGGNFGNEWLQHTLAWHKAYDKHLPAAIQPINAYNIEAFETTIVKNWLIRLKHERISLANQLKWLRAIRIWLYPGAWPNIPLFLFKPLFKTLSSRS